MENITKILWHALPLAKVFDQLKSSQAGLTKNEILKRQKKFGYNQLPEGKKLSSLMIFISQFKSPLVYVLLGAVAISLILQDFTDSAIIILAVFINTILGFYQENKANAAISYLKKIVDFKTKVWRHGHRQEISTKELVPGDIIFLETGDKIPADAKLIKVDNLQVIEATLTGESMPSGKNSKILDKGTILADRENMVYAGTIVASGKATAIVCETGINTELGQITRLIKETPEEKTPLQNQLINFSKTLTYIVLGVCLGIIFVGKLQGRLIFGFGESARSGILTTAVAIAVAAIPESLLIATTVILAIGMQKILKQKALIRRLVAAETLGSVSVICTDKTGTLTEGRMQVSEIITAGEQIATKQYLNYNDAENLDDSSLVFKIFLLCNNATIENPDDQLKEWKFLGSPTEIALLLSAIHSGIPYRQIQNRQPKLTEIPFDSEIKFMATSHKLDKNNNVIYFKGAPEKILAMSDQVRINGKKESLTTEKNKSLKECYEKLTNQGLRVLALAYKKISPKKTIKLTDELNNLIFVGFVALKDPLRPEAKEMIRLAQKAGIKPVIITGDHQLTAKAIVRELGLPTDKKNIIEGWQLDKMSDQELLAKIRDIDIYARVEPRHKLRIVLAWQSQNEVVAMTGDGINDAPALKAADIGIALGSGTDVAKETADIILLDDNFKTIIAAVEQGRIIYENIKKVILYLLADGSSEIVLIAGSLLLGLPLPLLPAQIIWVNLIDDGLPNIAMTFEKKEGDVMNDKPRPKTGKIFNRELNTLILIISTVTNLLLFSIFYFLLKLNHYDISHIRTFIFAAIGIDSLFYVFSCRNLKHSIFLNNPFGNHYLNLAVLVGLSLQVLAIYQPYLQKIFETVPLNLADWLFLIMIGFLNILIIEAAKYFFIIKKNQKSYAG